MINNREVEVIVDSGAAISVITEPLRKELKLPIGEKSDITCTLANGGKIASLGKVNTEIEIDEQLIKPIVLNVIESKQAEIIIGNDLLGEWNANINYNDEILEIQYGEEIVDIPIWYVKRLEDSDESEYESGIEESDYEDEMERLNYEQENRRNLYTIKEIAEEKEIQKVGISNEESSTDYTSSEDSSEDEI